MEKIGQNRKPEWISTTQLIVEVIFQQIKLKAASDPNERETLTRASQSIVDKDGGRDFLRNLGKVINDKDRVIRNLKDLFKNDEKLKSIFEKKPRLEELWYEHTYLALKSAVIVAANKDKQD